MPHQTPAAPGQHRSPQSMRGCSALQRPTHESIADVIRAVFVAEKPSGRFKLGEHAVTADGVTLGTSPRDPDFFIDGAAMTAEYRAELIRANCHYDAPTENGLTWRDFSRARGYTEAEIAQYDQLLTWLAEAGLSHAMWVHLSGFGPGTDQQLWDGEEGIRAGARVLAERLPSALTA